MVKECEVLNKNLAHKFIAQLYPSDEIIKENIAESI